MSIGTTLDLYKNYSPEDKAALKALREETEKRLGTPVSLAEILAMVEPGLEAKGEK